MSDIPEFKSLVKTVTLDGDKVRIDDIVNTDIVITGFHISDSKYQNKGREFCTKVQFYCLSDSDKIRKVFFTGSSVIKEQVEEVKKSLEEQGLQLMFKATVKKIGNYYSLV